MIADLPNNIRNDEDAIRNCVRACGAFTHIFDDDGNSRVQLTNSSVRDYLKSKTEDWLSMPSSQIQHGIISLRCFDYVRDAVAKTAALNRKKHEDEVREAEAQDKESDEGDGENHETLKNNKAGEEDNETKEETEDAENEPDLPLIEYPYTEWIEHALQSTPDIVECFGVEEVFWLLDSEERAEWSTFYSRQKDEPEFDIGFTALHIAAYFGYVPLANLLLRNGAHVAELHAEDTNGHQPIYWACRKGRMNMVQKLCEEMANINGTEEEISSGATPLHGAAFSGIVEIAEYLLDKGATIDVLNENNGTALYVAVDLECLPIIQLLLDQGADPNAIGGEELTALNVACYHGTLETVQLLVSKGAELNPDIEYTWGNALGIAAFYEHTDVVKYLLKNGCRFDKSSSGGENPLSLAAGEGYAEIIRHILGYDKDPKSHNHALMPAVEYNHVECVRTIIERCPILDRIPPFRAAARYGYSEILGILTNSGVPFEEMSAALYEATDYQHVETVKVLLEMGADPNAEGDEYASSSTFFSFPPSPASSPTNTCFCHCI